MHKISCLFFTCLLLYGCTAVKKTGNKEVVLPGITVSAADDNRGIYRESAPRHWDILHTRAALFFNLKERTASGRACTPASMPSSLLKFLA